MTGARQCSSRPTQDAESTEYMAHRLRCELNNINQPETQMPNDPCFDWKRPCFGSLTFKNRGHQRVPGIYKLRSSKDERIYKHPSRKKTSGKVAGLKYTARSESNLLLVIINCIIWASITYKTLGVARVWMEYIWANYYL